MKKLFLSLSMILVFVTFVNAQYKPTSGFTAEVNFRPFTATPIQVNYLKARMFLSENMAVRLGLELNSFGKTDKAVFNAGTPTELIEETKSSYFIFGLNPGIEMHMPGTDRLSPYFGAELNFSMKSSSTDITNKGGNANKTEKYEGCWSDGTNNAYSIFGLNLLFGADYYITKSLYMGAEMGLGFQSRSGKDITFTATTGGVSNSYKVPGGSETNLGVNFNSAIRLGWAF